MDELDDVNYWFRYANKLENAFTLFSGGRDSLATLAYVKENVPEVKALYVDTTISLPHTKDYIREVCKNLKVPIIILKPKVDFETLVEKWGLPSVKKRWCCYHLKVQPLQDYLRPLHSKVVFDGIRAEESPKRRKFGKIWYYDKRKFRCFCIHPIYYWTKVQVENFLRERKLKTNPIYDLLNFSGECYCGVFSHKPEFMKLKAHFPNFFEKLVEIEEKVRTGYTYIYHKGKKIPLRELKKQKTLNEVFRRVKRRR